MLTLWYPGMHDIGMILEICYENCLTNKTTKKKKSSRYVIIVFINVYKFFFKTAVTTEHT